MKLTQKQAMEAYTTVRKLENQDMPGEKAMALFRARRALEPQYQFQDEQERKTLESLGCSIGDTGAIVFPDAESREKYILKLEELRALEVEVDLARQPFEIKGLTMNAKDIEALDEIMEIVC